MNTILPDTWACGVSAGGGQGPGGTMEVLTLTVVCHERRPPADDIFLHPGTWRSRRSWRRWPRPGTGWATRPRLPDPRAVQGADR